MLVLSRKVGERILIPSCEVAITVVAIEGGKVRLGISAPTEIAIFREEIWEAKKTFINGETDHEFQARDRSPLARSS